MIGEHKFNNNKKTIHIPDDTSDEYNNYLSEIDRWNSDKHLEQLKLDASSLENIHITTFTQISNPQEDLRIDNIDSHPNVVIQEGKNYIMKYVKKKIPK